MIKFDIAGMIPSEFSYFPAKIYYDTILIVYYEAEFAWLLEKVDMIAFKVTTLSFHTM